MEYSIVEHIAVLGTREYKGEEWAKELNLVSWNHRPPKLDIREWSRKHEIMSKGVTLTTEEAERLCMALHNHLAERSE